MVADLDKGGEKEDEYFSEVTGEEHIEGEDTFKFNDPLANVEIEDAEIAPEKPSAMRKVGTAIVIVIVALIVSMYLSHKQKMKEAAQLGKTTPQASATSKALPDLKTDMKPAEAPATNESTEMKAPVKAPVTTESSSATPTTPAASAPTVDNASLAAAISKGVSPVTPAKSETNLAAAISKEQNTPPAPAPVATKAAEKSAAPAAKSEPVKAAEKPATPVTKSEPVKTAVKPAENAVAKPAEAPAKELPAKVSEPAAAAVSSETPKIMGRIEDLNLQTQANQTKISDLSTRLDSIDKSMAEINKTLGMLEKKSSAPQAAVAKEGPVTPTPPVFKKVEKAAPASMSQKMNIAAEHPRKMHHKHQRRMPQQLQAMQQQSSQQQTMMQDQKSNSMPYVLKAIIPGRAWIERPLAGVISVMEGDYVPGMGKVVTIDEDNGEVTLDTGDVIKYGMDDH